MEAISVIAKGSAVPAEISSIVLEFRSQREHNSIGVALAKFGLSLDCDCVLFYYPPPCVESMLIGNAFQATNINKM